ncbi:hypothetical protein QJN67_27410 [Escherichia coli]|nr:hypothetical protein [Escherichia coli]WNT62344.1 hypothetical protein PWR53_25080 [Escherichia coli]
MLGGADNPNGELPSYITGADIIGQPDSREEPMSQPKPFEVSKYAVWKAYQRVKANRGAAGVDGQSVEAFEVTNRSYTR